MDNNADLVVRTEHLTKHFGKLVAVDDLSLEVRKGEIFGFLGPNGAGKSTTVGMMLGLVAPTSGKVEIFGLDTQLHLPQILKRVGAMTESIGFYPYLSGENNLNYIARITGGISSTRIEKVLDLVELSGREKDKFSTYSLGMKQRLAIACSLLSDPEFIVLDEPTNGLDPAGVKEIRELIIKLGHEGKTIFLNSHLLHEVEQICERVAIIQHGKMITQGPVKDLMKKGDLLQLQVTEPEKAMAVLNNLDWIRSIVREDDKLFIDVNAERYAQISAVLAREDIFITEMRAKDNTLEDFFLEITEERTN
ncbi:MAG: ABC transporter ATP-binding protein [Dehalococcoidales bacterium]|nr:ABC transporter ATP-binding protein [Dehalococcoidales bacterium]